ncbi:MAG: hypothetical protein HYU36_22550 [Planctomycetes bacterium]|nr:hypothetical protein [Planctomycetota bacterium]
MRSRIEVLVLLVALVSLSLAIGGTEVRVRFEKADRPGELVTDGLKEMPGPLGRVVEAYPVLRLGEAGPDKKEVMNEEGVPELREMGVITAELAEGEHVVWPGGQKFLIRNGEMQETPPAAAGEEGLYVIRCHPVQVASAADGGGWLPFNLELLDAGGVRYQGHGLFALTIHLPPGRYRANQAVFEVDGAGRILIDGRPQERVVLVQPATPAAVPEAVRAGLSAVHRSTGRTLAELAAAAGEAAGSVSLVTDRDRGVFLEGEEIELSCVLRCRETVERDLGIELAEMERGDGGEPGRPLRLGGLALSVGPVGDRAAVAHLRLPTGVLRPGAYEVRIVAGDGPGTAFEAAASGPRRLSGAPALLSYPFRFTLIGRHRQSHMNYHIWSWASDHLKDGGTRARDSIRRLERAGFDLYIGQNHHLPPAGGYPARGHVEDRPALPPAEAFYAKHSDEALMESLLEHRVSYMVQPGGGEERCIKHSLEWDVERDIRLMMLYAQVYARFPNFLGLDYHDDADILGDGEVLGLKGGVRFGSYMGKMTENYEALWRRPWDEPHPPLDRTEHVASLLPGIYRSWGRALKRLDPQLWGAAAQQSGGGGWRIPTAHRELDVSATQAYSDGGCFPYQNELTAELFRAGLPETEPVWVHAHGGEWGLRGQHIQVALSTLSRKIEGLGFWPGGFDALIWERNDGIESWFNQFQKYGRAERTALIGEIVRRFGDTILALDRDFSVALYNDRFGPTGPYWGGKEQAWIELLKAHYPAVWVADEDILAGRLERTRVLVLEGTSWVIPPVRDALEKFIGSGGIVAGDTTVKLDLPGLRRLDFTFGGAMPPMPAPGAVDHHFLRSQAKRAFEPVRKFMKETCGLEPWADAETPDVTFGRLSLGPVEMLFVLNDKTPWEFSEQWAQRYFVPEKFQVSVPAGKTVYDLFDQRAVQAERRGGRDAWTADLRGIFGRMYLLLPEPVGQLEVEVSSSTGQGERLAYAATLLGVSGKPIRGPVPVEVVLRLPDGRERYRLYRSTGSGTLREFLKVAANDPQGTWEMSVRELLTGGGRRLKFEVAERPAALHAAEMGRHLTVEPAAVREFLREAQGVRILLDRAQEGLTPAAERLAEALRAAGSDARVDRIVPEMLQKHPTVWYYDGDFLEQVEKLAGGRVIAQTWKPGGLDVRKETGIRVEDNRGYDRWGPWPMVRGNLVLLTAHGNLLAQVLERSPYLQRDGTAVLPGPGGSLAQLVTSPFWGGSDVLLVRADEGALGEALDGLARLAAGPPPARPAPGARWTMFRPPAACLDRTGSATAWDDWEGWGLPASSAPAKSEGIPFEEHDLILEGKAGEPVHALGVSPDGDLVAAGVDSFHRNVFLLDREGRVRLAALAGTTYGRRVVWDIRVAAAAREMLVTTGEARYRLDQDGRITGRLPAHFFYALPDGRMRYLVSMSGGLACHAEDGSLLWYYDDRQDAQTFRDVRYIRKPVAMVVSRDGSRVAAVFQGNTSHWFRDWHYRTGTVVLDGETGRRLWQKEGLASAGMRFAEDGSLLATMSGDHLQIYGEAGQVLIEQPVGGELREVQIAPGGRCALVREHLMERVQVFRIPGGERLVVPLAMDTASMDISANGKLAAVGCWDHQIVVIDLETGEVVRKLPVKGGSQVKFLPGGGLAAGSNAGWVHRFAPDGREEWAHSLADDIYIPDYFQFIQAQKEPEVETLRLASIPVPVDGLIERLPAWVRRSANLLEGGAAGREFRSRALPSTGLYAFRFHFPALPSGGTLEVRVSQGEAVLVHARGISEGYGFIDGWHIYDLLFKARRGEAVAIELTSRCISGGVEVRDAALHHLSFPRPNLAYAPGAGTGSSTESLVGKKADPVVPKLVIESLSWGHTSGSIGTAAFLKPSFEATMLTNGVPYDVTGAWASEKEVQANRDVYVGAVLPKGYLEITLPKPEKLGCLVVYFNPATPEETAREYLLEGWDGVNKTWKCLVRRLDPAARDWHLGPAWHQGEGFLRHPSDRYAQMDVLSEGFVTDKVRFWPIWTGNERQCCSEVEIYGWPLSETEQEQEMFDEPGEEKEGEGEGL